MSFDAKATIYSSLVALVKAEYSFDNILQDRAAQFLKSLVPMYDHHDSAAKLVTDLVPSSAGPSSGFVASIVTLLSSPHSTVVAAALSFLSQTTLIVTKLTLRLHLVESDLIIKVLATVQPQTLPISGNEEIFDNLNWIIDLCLDVESPYYLEKLGFTAEIDKLNHHEMIFQKVVLPSSQYVTFLISNRSVLYEALFRSFMSLLGTLLDISPFHRPTLEFVLASPITMTLSSCPSVVENEDRLWTTLGNINDSLLKWKKNSPEVAQSGKRMIQALFSEGFEDTLEQMIRKKDGRYGLIIINHCRSISQLLGANV